MARRQLFWPYDPWDLEDVLMTANGNQIRFDRVPVLAEHISIPPHTIVKHAKHRYSFTESGTDLCFHSPESIPDGAVNLAKFLMAASEGFLGRGIKITPESSAITLKELIQSVIDTAQERDFFQALGAFDEDDPFGKWFAWGDYLHTEYGIDQYALVRWKE